MKKILLLFFSCFGFVPMAISQTAAAAEASTSIWNDPMLLFYVTVGFIFVVVLLVLAVALYMLQVVNILANAAERERAEKLGIPYKPSPSVWQKLWSQSNDFKPLEQEGEIMLDHDYDGIRELDNHLPPWWKGLFYLSILFSVVYLLGYHVFDSMPLSKQEYETEVAQADEQMKKMQAANPVASIDETNVEQVTDAQALADGKQTFVNNCASCHRKDGGGDIGPNLTDEYWLHGGSIKDVFKTIRHGVQGTNMIAWEGFISPEKMRNVASYVLSIQGSNPANPKKPQGDPYKPNQQNTKTDSVKTQASL